MPVPITSELKRKGWMRQGLVQAAAKSFWTPLTGNSKDSVVFQAKNESAGEGHTVVFDFNGNLNGKAVRGKETAFGKGEEKRKFSDKLVVDRYRLVVDNGDAFDGVEIGDLEISQHSQSRAMLGDLFVRFKDQALFDAAQGLLKTQAGTAMAPTHIIDLGSTFDFNSLITVETAIKTGVGFTTGASRRPLDPYMTSDGRPMWLLIVDPAMAAKLKQSTGFQTISKDADIRGNDNRLISGVIGRLGNLVIREADAFYGYTDATGTTWGMNDTGIEIAGLRQKDAAGKWTGQAGFSTAGNVYSRGLILGAGAMQLGYGKMPDYKYQESQDFGIKSESALEVWMEVKKTSLNLEQGENYKQAKISNLDYGVIALDLQVK